MIKEEKNMLNKTWKKFMAFGMAAVMTAGMLTGCGGGSKDSDKSSDSSSNASSEAGDGTLDTSEEVELVMYVVSDRPAGQDTVDEAINAILKEKLNCTLKINWIGWAEYANKYPLLFSSGEQFDMAYCATWLNFKSLAQRGAFMALDELWPTYAPDNYALASEDAKAQATVNGSIYCIPTLQSTYNTYGATYRTDILEGTDWEEGRIIESLADMEDYFAIVKEAAPELEPFEVYSAGCELYKFGYMSEQGYTLDKNVGWIFWDPTEENPQLTMAYDYEGTTDFLEMMVRWNEAGYFSKNGLADTDSTKTQNGKAALKFHNIGNYQSFAIQHPEWEFEFGTITEDIAHLPYTQDALVISNTSQNPERALAFWNLVTTDQELYDTFMYGVEGTTYTLNEEGQYTITDNDLYATSACWAVRTDELNREPAGSPARYTELMESFSEAASTSPAEKYAAFSFDTSAVETEYAACNNVYQQYWMPLELGYNSNGVEGGLAEYKEKMEAAGIDKVLEVFQSQLDEYVAGLAE